MNEIEKNINIGLQMLRNRGINYTAFKEKLAELLVGTEGLGQDELVELYNNYAYAVGDMSSIRFETLEDWASIHFHGWNKKEHSVYLKKQ